MKISTHRSFLFGCLLLCTFVMPLWALKKRCHVDCHGKKVYAPLFNQESVSRDAFVSIFRNVIDLNLQLISWDSFKVIVATFPFVIAGRMVDSCVNECFIERSRHKNKNQLDCFFQQFARYGFVFPVFLGGVLSVAARDPDVKFTSRMFILGFPFVYLCTKFIKKIDGGCTIEKRPWCEGFSRTKRANGGFPSGHLAIYAYAAFLYGKRFGMPYAVPLGALTALTAVAFVNCNRHYVSQVAAGIGLGALFAYAADKVVEKRLNCDFSFSLGACSKGCPAMTLSYAF